MTQDPVAGSADTLARAGIRLSRSQLDRFERYSALLRQRNERLNLTAIVDPAEIVTKHFLDSLTPLLVRPPKPDARLVDVGTGAGFPGVPLAIARPDLRVTLVESVGKKVRFLEELLAALELEHVAIAQGRAEELAHEAAHRERYDVAVVRALPQLATNLELLLPFCRLQGEAIAYKGRVEAERPAAERAAAALGGEIERIVTTDQLSLGDVLPGRCLVIVPKRRPTPSPYPRRVTEMKRRPW
jgi:16S rRNA (guanine527-N7)-methyltransferase